MAEFALGGFARELRWLAVRIEETVPVALARAAVIVEREVAHYQRTVGILPCWPKLKPRTIAEKRWPDFAPADNQLPRAGKALASIGHHVSAGTFEDAAQIGSNEAFAEYQARGTRRNLPGRSFLLRAAVRKEKEIAKLLGEAAFTVLGAQRIP
ncbi:MAG: hypothetical protein ACREFP_04105 [Acetobacteraceae bacterium]